MVILNFLDEKVEIQTPRTYGELLESIKREYALEYNELEGLSLYFLSVTGEKIVVTESVFDFFLFSKSPELFIEAGEESKMYNDIAKSSLQQEEKELNKMVTERIVKNQLEKINQHKNSHISIEHSPEQRKANNRDNFLSGLNKLRSSIK